MLILWSLSQWIVPLALIDRGASFYEFHRDGDGLLRPLFTVEQEVTAVGEMSLFE